MDENIKQILQAMNIAPEELLGDNKEVKLYYNTASVPIETIEVVIFRPSPTSETMSYIGHRQSRLSGFKEFDNLDWNDVKRLELGLLFKHAAIAKELHYTDFEIKGTTAVVQSINFIEDKGIT